MRRLARLGTLVGLILGVSGCLDGSTMVPDRADGGAFGDGGPATDAQAPPVDFSEGRASPGTCYDGDDNNEDGRTDCDDAMCGVDPVCCVGSAAEGCCVAQATITMAVPAGGCDGSSASACTELEPGLTFFGATEPAIEDGGLVPQGGAGHGGVALGGPIDPRRLSLSLDAVVRVPEARCADCVDVVGIGLVEALPEAGQSARIRIGVLASGSRDEAIIVIGDEPVQRLPLPVGELSLRIELDVDGAGRIVAGDADVPLSGLELPPRLYAVVVGRTDARDAGEPAVTVRDATLERSTCDVPGALDRQGQVLPASTSAWRPSALGRPSVAVAADTGRVWAAFEHDGEIRMAGADDAGELLGEPSEPSAPVVERPPGVERAFDPWLMAVDDHFVLYFAGEDGDGIGRLYRAEADAGWGRAFGAAIEVLGPETLEDVASLDGPTVWMDGGVERMIARALTVQGVRVLVAFEQRPFEDTLRWELKESDLEASLVLRPGADLFSIERDEVAAPAVVVAPGADGALLFRLYYGARRGTRWSIGLLVSEEGNAWRSVGAVLEPSGVGFDGLGVTDPAPVALDGGVRLYYRGWDGARSAFGRAGPAGTMGE